MDFEDAGDPVLPQRDAEERPAFDLVDEVPRRRSRVAWLLVPLSTGFGLGLSPIAPGTMGSLLGPPLLWGMQRIPSPFAYAGVAVVVLLAGVPICGYGQRYFGVKDPGMVVYDEIAAFLVVFALCPVTWTTAVLGFLWFRVFDIWKPWPLKWMEVLPGGWGVMADDLGAGVYAAAALHLTLALGVKP